MKPTKGFKLLYLASNEWGNLGRRKVRLAYELAAQDDIASILYLNPPVPASPSSVPVWPARKASPISGTSPTRRKPMSEALGLL